MRAEYNSLDYLRVIAERADEIRGALRASQSKVASERDAMAWQVFLAKQSQAGAQGTDTEAWEAYSAVDAFLHQREKQRKRQQGEG